MFSRCSRGAGHQHPGPPVSSKQLALHTLVYSVADTGAWCNIDTARLPNFDVSHAISVLARAAPLSTSKFVVENSVSGVCELVEIVRQEVSSLEPQDLAHFDCSLWGLLGDHVKAYA